MWRFIADSVSASVRGSGMERIVIAGRLGPKVAFGSEISHGPQRLTPRNPLTRSFGSVRFHCTRCPPRAKPKSEVPMAVNSDGAQGVTEGATAAHLGRRSLGVADIVFFVVAASAPLTVVAGGVPTSFAVTNLLGIPLVYVIIFDIAGIAKPAEGLTIEPFLPAALSPGALGAALCFVTASFVGFESAAIYGEECKNPQRTVARATYTAA